ncbi:MAG: ATP-binding protein [Synechococcales bacterium]|nr:ATP-binding protein [Synechococcales bacterium]
MFQTTRRRLAVWYTAITAILLLLFATGFYFYVRSTLVERVDDTLSHVVEVVQRSLVIESIGLEAGDVSRLHVNIDATFRDSSDAVDDDHIDLEWFSPTGELLWTTFDQPLPIPIHLNRDGETVRWRDDQLLRQITQRVQRGRQVLGYLRVSHPWFEVTKPSRQLIIDLAAGTLLMVGAVAAIGWFLSGLAMAPVRDSYQRLKQFTADASHELRNPIAVIQTNVQVALADPDADPQFQQAQFRVIERITRRLGRMVDDLLFLARQDSGITQLTPQQVSLYGLLTEVVAEQEALASDQGVDLTLELGWPQGEGDDPRSLASPLCLVRGDRDQLVRLFTNLISNAIQYTVSGETVQVIVTRSPLPSHHQAQCTVQIRDTGIGIAPEVLPHIFDRFYRADPSRSAKGGPAKAKPEAGGSGLGLAIARAIVENHQGHIQVESQLGEGTTFTVTLPAQTHA